MSRYRNKRARRASQLIRHQKTRERRIMKAEPPLQEPGRSNSRLRANREAEARPVEFDMTGVGRRFRRGDQTGVLEAPMRF